MNNRPTLQFLAPDELVKTIGHDNTILDAHSVLISKKAVVGKDNVFYPNVVIECEEQDALIIGNGNTFYPGVYIISSIGMVRIGDTNEFGPAGVTIKANSQRAMISIGNGGRYCDGASIIGQTNLGDGSQILGNITVQSCSLESGGTNQEPDPDKRAGVLKGFGLARNLSLNIGQVINGAGNFENAPVEWQRSYHPKK